VVEEPADRAAIERSGGFSGRYHVLGGALAPIDGIGPDQLRIAELERRVEARGVR
jgi:recombination protein RecR